MDELDPITVAALEALKLDTDRVPKKHSQLEAMAAARTPLTEWTWDQAAAYQHLWALIKTRRDERPTPEAEQGGAELLTKQ